MTDRAISLEWSEHKPPCAECGCDHTIAHTPFGRFRLIWKSWKAYDHPEFDETPWGEFWCGGPTPGQEGEGWVYWSDVEGAKAAAAAEMTRRVGMLKHAGVTLSDKIALLPEWIREDIRETRLGHYCYRTEAVDEAIDEASAGPWALMHKVTKECSKLGLVADLDSQAADVFGFIKLADAVSTI